MLIAIVSDEYDRCTAESFGLYWASQFNAVIEASLVTPWLVSAEATPSVSAEAGTSAVGGVVIPSAPSPSDIASANEEAVEEAMIGTDVSRMRRFMACDGRLTLADIEREAILATLDANRGHRQKSARALGIGVRTLGMKLKRWKEEHLVPEAT